MIDIGYAAALFGGMLSLLSPCAALLLPAFFAYAFSSPSALFSRSLVFYLGLLTTLVPLGAAASTVGGAFVQHREAFVYVAAAAVALLGTLQVFGITPSIPRRWLRADRESQDRSSPVAVYLLGTVYGIAGVCSGPILGSILTVAAVGSSAGYGAALLAIYAAGMVLPIVVLALLWDRFELGHRKWLRPKPVNIGPFSTTVTNVASGSLFVLIAVLLATTDGTANLGGILSIGDQAHVESQTQKLADSIPDLVILLLAGVALLAVALAHRSRRPARLQPLHDGDE